MLHFPSWLAGDWGCALPTIISLTLTDSAPASCGARKRSLTPCDSVLVRAAGALRAAGDRSAQDRRAARAVAAGQPCFAQERDSDRRPRVAV